MPTNRHQTPKARRRRSHRHTHILKALRRQRRTRPRLRLSMGTARRIAELDAALETAAGSSVAEEVLGEVISDLITDVMKGRFPAIAGAWGVTGGEGDRESVEKLRSLVRRWAEKDGKGRGRAAE